MAEPNCQLTYAECVCNGGSPEPFPKADGVLEGPMVDRATMRVDVVHGNGAGHAPGEMLKVSTINAEPDEIVLVPVTLSDAAPPVLAGLVLDPTGRPWACTWNDTVKKLPVTKFQAIDALRSDNCVAAMAAVAREWSQARPQCGGNCSVAGGDPSVVVSAFLAVVAFRSVALRRARRAPRREERAAASSDRAGRANRTP